MGVPYSGSVYQDVAPSDKVGPCVERRFNYWRFEKDLLKLHLWNPSGGVNDNLRVFNPRYPIEATNPRIEKSLTTQHIPLFQWAGGAFENTFDCFGDRCDGGTRLECDECSLGVVECQECNGDGTNTCYECDGDGEMEVECEECGGAGETTEECPEVDCDAGWVPCEDCEGEGKDEKGKKCEECDGEGQIECQNCDEGEVMLDCQECDAQGQVTEECEYCYGEGETNCDYCDEGEADCDHCGGDFQEEECDVCGGRGKLTNPSKEVVSRTSYYMPPLEENREARLGVWEELPITIRNSLFGTDPLIEFIPLKELTQETLKKINATRRGVFSFLIIPAQIPIDPVNKSSSGIKIVVLKPWEGAGGLNATKYQVMVLKEGHSHWITVDLNNTTASSFYFPGPKGYQKLNEDAMLITTRVSAMAPLPFLNTLIPTSSVKLSGNITEETFNKIIRKK